MTTPHHKKISHLKRSDPKLKIVIEGVKLKEVAETRGRFEALVEAIVSQQLSVKASDTIFARFSALTPGKKFPMPREIVKMRAPAMRKAGLSRMKVSFIKDLAAKVLEGSLDLKNIDKLRDEEVIEQLTRVKGIGQWTAEMFLLFSLQRDDIFSYGDLALRNAMQKIYKMKKPPTQAQAEKIAAKWKPYRSLGSRYLWASLRKK
jgi:DNA-3-methyladenine glycosylase II